jgi:hypothetical protein
MISCMIQIFVITVPNQPDLIGFQLNAVVQIASFHSVIPFGAPFGIDLTLLLATSQFFNLLIKS